MSAAQNEQDPLERLAQISDDLRGVAAQFATMQAAWPDDEVIRATDVSGALTLETTSKGEVTSVSLADDWAQRIGPRSLARAVNEAIGKVQASVGTRWIDALNKQDGTGVEPAPRPRQVTLEEYRAVFPAPTTREGLRERAIQRAEARAARERAAASQSTAPERELFTSPQGHFKVTRSGSQLAGIELTPYALATISPDEVGAEIVAVLADVETRALGATGSSGAPRPINRMRVLRELH